jgi:hypothetical protein
MEEIEKHRQQVKENILKAFDNDIEKAVAQIGETREWSDGTYKKVQSGKWVKVIDGKEKQIASSGMVKKLKEESKTNQERWNKIKSDFESSLVSKYPKGTFAYKIFFNHAWANETKRNAFIKKINDQQKDLRDEIKEIETIIAEEKKLKRENIAGKKEYGEDEVKKSLADINSIFVKIRKEIPDVGTADVIAPEVTVDDYYLDTEADFKSIEEYKPFFEDREDGRYEVDNVGRKWKEMKDSGKYEYTHSPKSSSQYLVNKNNGDIYRMADHWGRCASCYWGVNFKKSNYGIAKCNVKDFSRKTSGIWFNPQYRIKMVEAAEIVLPRLKKMISSNEKFYLTDKANKSVLECVYKIFHDLQWSANMSIEEIDKLKSKYELI